MATESSRRWLWFTAGFSLGLGLALLYAPWPGAETRRLISQKAGASKDALLQSGRELLERGRELYEKGRQIADEAAELFDEGKKLVETLDSYSEVADVQDA